MSYNAIVARLENVRSHSNADRLKLATCLGYQVIVGLGAKDGDLMVLFPDDGQLSEEYAKANDLIGYTAEDGTKKGGYFDSSRRVRAQRFRGEKSEAYVAPLSSFAFTGEVLLPEGTRFNELNGVPICNKFVTEATRRAARASASKTPKLNQELKRLFPEHIETEQIRHARSDELKGLVTITHKLHGTSGRSALLEVPVPQTYSFWQKVRAYICKEDMPETVVKWQSVYGTRRVIKGEVQDDAADYRSECHRLLQPHILKNEVWYYEIVGFEDTGASIMQVVGTEKMPKESQKRFGKTMTYKYGCLPGKCEVYVYRIAVMGADGEKYELPWGVVKDRCRKAGIKHVPEIFCAVSLTTDDAEFIKNKVEFLTEGGDLADPIDQSHIREGVCVRVDDLHSGKMRIFKNKTFAFKVLEGIVKDSGVVDTEEAEAA